MKRAYVEIDLKKLADNISHYRSIIPSSTKLMAVVKADGYGHGALEVADVAVANGADYLGVAWVQEAIQLREARIKAPILILSEPTVNVAADIVRLDVTQTVYTLNYATVLSEAAKKMGKTAKVHIKIDTGMGRIGVNKEEAVDLVEQIYALDNIEVEGIFTHFARADDPADEYTQIQFNRFAEVLEVLEKNGFTFAIKHTANSSAALNYPQSHMDMVRIGIGLYKDVLSFKSRISYMKTVPAGTFVSYGGTYQTSKETTIATISAGYADGLVRLLSSNGNVLIGGKKYPIVGRVCMDMTMADLGRDHYPVGQEVTLIGSQGNSTIPVDEVARQAQTINYEILCGIGKRVNRIYLY